MKGTGVGLVRPVERFVGDGLYLGIDSYIVLNT